MDVIHVEGANGSLHTNYLGKAEAAIQALLVDHNDFVYIHVEAPDEMGHQGNLWHKVQSIEQIDRNIITVVKKALEDSGEAYRILVLPDHPTPICKRTHTSDPVPFVLFDSNNSEKKETIFSEKTAAATGVYIAEGHKMIDLLLK